MLEISIESFDALSDGEKNEASNNGSGKEYASYLRVRLNGETIALESSAMEPEDVQFYRDLRWIGPLLQRVYEAGKAERAEGENMKMTIKCVLCGAKKTVEAPTEQPLCECGGPMILVRVKA